MEKLNIKFDCNNKEDINEVFTLLCKYFELDKKKEEKVCFDGETVDVNVIIKFCERYGLKLTLDFESNSDDNATVNFLPLTLDITTVDEKNEEAEVIKQEELSKDLEEIKKAKEIEDDLPTKSKPKVDFDDDDFDEL